MEVLETKRGKVTAIYWVNVGVIGPRKRILVGKRGLEDEDEDSGGFESFGGDSVLGVGFEYLGYHE